MESSVFFECDVWLGIISFNGGLSKAFSASTGGSASEHIGGWNSVVVYPPSKLKHRYGK